MSLSKINIYLYSFFTEGVVNKQTKVILIYCTLVSVSRYILYIVPLNTVLNTNFDASQQTFIGDSESSKSRTCHKNRQHTSPIVVMLVVGAIYGTQADYIYLK